MGTGGDAFDQGGEGFGGGFLFEGEREIGLARAFGGAGFEFAELAVVGFFDVGGGGAEDGGDGEGFVFEIGDVDEVGVRLEGRVHGEVREGVELAGFVGFGGDEGDDGSHEDDERPMEAEGETSEEAHGLGVEDKREIFGSYADAVEGWPFIGCRRGGGGGCRRRWGRCESRPGGRGRPWGRGGCRRGRILRGWPSGGIGGCPGSGIWGGSGRSRRCREWRTCGGSTAAGRGGCKRRWELMGKGDIVGVGG